MGLHKVGAAPGCEHACTLHLYAPPFDKCCVWLDAAQPDRVMRPVITYHSEYGQVVDYAPPAGEVTITGEVVGTPEPADAAAAAEDELD